MTSPKLILPALAVLLGACAPGGIPSASARSAEAGAHQAGTSTQWQAIERELEDMKFSGVAAVVRDGTILHSAVLGLANLETRAPNTLHTGFGLASTGKLFTVVGILQLVDEGKISLSDPVGRFMPDYPNEAIRERATIQHLISMSSGLGDYFGEQHDRRQDELRSLADYVPLFADKPIAFEPGSGFEYSNAGYVLLGRIIEIAAEEDYYDYIERNVFEPSGMTATGFGGSGATMPDMATGYMVEGLDGIAESRAEMLSGKLVPNSEGPEGRGTSAGGGFATVPDFARFDQALRNGTLVKRDLLGAIFGQAYVDGAKPAGIAGGAPGWSTRYRLLPDGRSIIVFGNLDVPSSIEVAEIIESRLFD